MILQTPSESSIFLQSFGILVREGLEALLICTALVAAAAKAGSAAGVRAVWHGVAAALVASVATAVLVDRALALTEADQEGIEGVTMVLAALVLFYVSYWLLSKLEVDRWMGYLQERMRRARNRWAIGAVAFFAVYREGAETVLFYRALAGFGESREIWLGILAGALVMIVIGAAVIRYGVRLPLKPLFAVTGVLLYYLAFVFAGGGVHELQEAGWVRETPIAGVPEIAVLGIHPTLESLAAQSILAALALLAVFVTVVRGRRER